jgi:hypothetical protein
LKRVVNHEYLTLKDAAAKLGWSVDDVFLELTQGNENSSFGNLRAFGLVGSDFRKNVVPNYETFEALGFDPESITLTDDELSSIATDDEIVFEKLKKDELDFKIQEMISASNELHSFQLDQDIHCLIKNSIPLNMVILDTEILIKFHQSDEVALTQAYTVIEDEIVRLDWNDSEEAFTVNKKQLRISSDDLNIFMQAQLKKLKVQKKDGELAGREASTAYAIIRALLKKLEILENDPKLVMKLVKMLDESEIVMDPRTVARHIQNMQNSGNYRQ